MNSRLLINLVRFIVLIPLQVFIFDNINLNGHINPMVYIYFVLLLPFETPGWLLLFSAFAMGLSIDLFNGTPGLNTSATVLIAFLRPFIIRMVSTNREFEPGMLPTIMHIGFRWFLTYAFLLTIIHHFVFFLVELFKLGNILSLFQRTVYTTLFTLVLMIIFQYLFWGKSKER